jgi:hypothetical protein
VAVQEVLSPADRKAYFIKEGTVNNDAINKNDANVSTKGVASLSLDSEANTNSKGFPLDEFSQSFAIVTVNPNHGRYFGLKLRANRFNFCSSTGSRLQTITIMRMSSGKRRVQAEDLPI